MYYHVYVECKNYNRLANKKKKTDIENKLVVTIEEKKDKLEVGDKEVCIYCYE